MSNIQQYTTFERLSINTDDSHLYMPKGSSPYNLNVAVGEDGKQGVVTLMKGNLQITYDQPLTLSNCYEVLGSYYNNLTRKMYFFLFSQPYLDVTPSPDEYKYDNRLLCFNEDAQTIDTIFIDTKNYFELDPAHHLTDIRMIGDWLFFNPVTAQPKMVDVVMAYNYANYEAYDDTDVSFSAQAGDIYSWRGGLFVANTSISAGEDPATATTKWDRIGDCYQDESTVSNTEFKRAFFAIKTPPTDRIVTAYGSDSTKNFNNVDGMMFRFCHRYQYFDNSFSVCSAHSDVTKPVDNELYNGIKEGSATRNNYINLTFSLYSSALIKNIEVYFQEVGGVWKRLAIVNRQDQTLLDTVNYTIAFYNNEYYPVIDQEIPYKVQDALPKLASTQEIINKNILCFAGCTEGFANIDKDLLDVTLTPTIHSIYEGVDETGTVIRDNITESGDITYSTVTPSVVKYYYTTINVTNFFSSISGSLSTNDVYKIVIEGIVNFEQLGAADIDTAAHLATAIATAANIYNGSAIATTNGSGDNVVNIISAFRYPSVTVSRIYTPSASVTSFTKIGGFKTQAYHPFCLFYYDEALRRSDAQLCDDMTVYVPSINDYSPPVTGTNYRWTVDWSVEHAPMAGMKYWRWGYAGNRRCGGNFVQYIVNSVLDGDSVPVDATVANTVAVNITALQTLRTTDTADDNVFPNSTIPSYSFTEGDRIRFMTEATNPAVTGTTLGDAIDGIYDFEILKYDDTNKVIFVQDFNYSAASIGAHTLVEIYSPIKGTSALDVTNTLTYYEFGDLMPIKEDVGGNMVHGGQTTDQVLEGSPVAATGSFSYGDVYHIMRTPSQPLCTATAGEKIVGAFHESNAWSDFYQSDEWSTGKFGRESLIGEVELNIVRYSNTYLQNTQINGLTSFEADHYKELNDVYGGIASIVEVGDTLKCYQDKKASSIQIGRTAYYDADGESTNVQTQSFVLGTIRYSPNNYGTTFPESISKNNRYVYGFDAYQGVVWRDSPAGIFPISGRYADIGGSVDYKMASYFKSKAKALLTSGIDHCQVTTVWDEEYKMLYINFQDSVDESNNDTVVFHEPSDRWITFTNQFEYTPSSNYNQLLELSYNVTKGFELGLNYDFDKDTRFASFNLTTSAGLVLEPSGLAPTITLPDPVVTIGVDLAPSAFAPTISLGDAVVTIVNEFVTLSDQDMDWTYNQSGYADAISSVVTCNTGAVWEITEIPYWLSYKVYNETDTLDITSSPAQWESGCVLKLYPTVDQDAGDPALSGTVWVGQDGVDMAYIAVDQEAGQVEYSVTVGKWSGDTSDLTISSGSGWVTKYTSLLHLTFTPSNIGSNVTLYYEIKFRTTVKGTGTISGCSNGVVKTVSVTASEAVDEAGDLPSVGISEDFIS